MSVRHIGLVLDHLEAPAPVKLVALILADHADSDGICWPSYRRIAERSCLSERTVRRYVGELACAGIVRKLQTGGLRSHDGERVWTSNHYRIDAAALAALPSLLKVVAHDHLQDDGKVVAHGQGGRTRPPKVVADGHPRWSHTSTKPSVEPSEGTVTLSGEVAVVESTSREELAEDFEEWWSASGRVGSKADAGALYKWWRTTGGASRDELLTAIVSYRSHCCATNCLQQHGRTFLVKATKSQPARWPEWASGEEHGSRDVAGASRVADVIEVGLDWIGGAGGALNGGGVAGIEQGRSNADPADGEDARRCLPQGGVASRE